MLEDLPDGDVRMGGSFKTAIPRLGTGMLCKHSSQRVVATAVQSTITNTRTQTIVSNFLNPLNPNIKIQILICYPYTFSIEVSKENLLKYQLDSSCVIMSLILMTTLFYKAVILHGEI